MNRGQGSNHQYGIALAEIRTLLQRHRAEEAAAACLELAQQGARSIEHLLLLARARQQQGRFDDMLQLAEQALARDPAHRGAQLQLAEACIFCGQHDRALTQLAGLEGKARNDPALLQHIAEFYAHTGKHDAAHRCYLRAATLAPDNAGYRYNLASSYVAMGELTLAEQAYSQVIDQRPDDYDAWHNRSTLRKATPTSNHIQELEARLARLRPGDAGEVPLCYALAREHEDLGDYDRGFGFLARGADSRRRRMGYKVEHDVAVMQRIGELFDAAYLARRPRARAHTGPIFVMGLPRSGTTLVDRIISSHSQVTSLGEINDFALTLTRMGQAADKNRLLEASINIDPERLGAAYLRSVGSYGESATRFIDKTPANFLYIGLIATALPGAAIVHVHRHPVDSCLAMYRTLFRMGYPFSYDLADLAAYYVAYDRLIRHWHAVLPGAMINVAYEELVDDQEHISRRIIEHCGLDWEPACLSFENNAAPVATASAAQVRQPIYRDALHRWRRYEKQLTPLIRRLEDAGIAI